MKITILASFAKDRIFDANGVLLREQQGGPAFFISNVFEEMGLSYTTFPLPEIVTEVMLTDGNELGKLPKVRSHTIDYKNIHTPYIVMSPIIGEFDLAGIEKYDGKIFLDIQGLTRVAGEFGKKKHWKTNSNIEDAIFCLKTADYELPYVNEQFINAQKKKILLVTQGSKGCTVYAFGKTYTVVPKKTIKSPDTLGAGDTFFALFLAHYIKTNNPRTSAEFATEKTLEFLTKKLHNFL